jgi:hypothetical protein
MLLVKSPVKDKGRLFGAILYFALSIFIFFLLPKIINYNYFYNEAIPNFSNYPRFLWCLACSFFGFSLIAFEASKGVHPGKRAIHSYYSIYLFALIAISSLVFGILHINKQTSSYLFYFISTPIAFYMGYQIDTTRTKILELLAKIKP